MALSPSIPTSFVPKQPVTPGKKRSSGSNLVIIFSFIIVAVTVVSAGGVFAYQQYLAGVEKTKGAELVTAQNNVNESTVDQFVRLRDRLTAAETVLSQHVALSQFFTLLDSLTLQDVSFSALNITVASDRTADIMLTGNAKDFNALAAESTAFASDPHIKSAIFSNITVDPTSGIVSFTVQATLDPSIVEESAATAGTPALLPAPGTTTSSTSPLSAAPTTSTSATNATNSTAASAAVVSAAQAAIPSASAAPATSADSTNAPLAVPSADSGTAGSDTSSP